jgi:hypothetical protein
LLLIKAGKDAEGRAEVASAVKLDPALATTAGQEGMAQPGK